MDMVPALWPKAARPMRRPSRTRVAVRGPAFRPAYAMPAPWSVRAVEATPAAPKSLAWLLATPRKSKPASVRLRT